MNSIHSFRFASQNKSASASSYLVLISLAVALSACSSRQSDTPTTATSSISTNTAESPLTYISQHKWTSGMNDPNLDSDGCKPNRYGVAMWQSFSEMNGLEQYSNGNLLDQSSSHKNISFKFSTTDDNKIRLTQVVNALQAPAVVVQAAFTEIALVDKDTITTDYTSFELKESLMDGILDGSLTSTNPKESPEKYNIVSRKRTEVRCD